MIWQNRFVIKVPKIVILNDIFHSCAFESQSCLYPQNMWLMILLCSFLAINSQTLTKKNSYHNSVLLRGLVRRGGTKNTKMTAIAMDFSIHDGNFFFPCAHFGSFCCTHREFRLLSNNAGWFICFWGWRGKCIQQHLPWCNTWYDKKYIFWLIL